MQRSYLEEYESRQNVCGDNYNTQQTYTQSDRK